MIFAFVGHRGVGKTSLLKRMRARDPNLRVVDLDQMIAGYEQKSVSDIFKAHGEAYFRKLESKMFSNLVKVSLQQLSDVWVALGAGFEGPMPTEVHVVWVRRAGDSVGRIFLDRPRLQPDLRPLDEYLERFLERQTRYSSWADDCLELREGSHRIDDPEEDRFLNERLRLSGGIRCLQSRDFARPHLDQKLRSLFEQNLSFIELRDDLLTDEQFRWAISRIPSDRTLVSFRTGKAHWLRHLNTQIVDLDVSLIDHPNFQSQAVKIVSWHPAQTMSDLKDTDLGQFESRALSRGAAIAKLAVPCNDFADLMRLHAWTFGVQTTLQKCGLPMSQQGRWVWYRKYLKGRSALSFVREFDTGVSDQPSLLDWSAAPHAPQKFAAVLGEPVWQSQSPLEHAQFFNPFWAVPLTQHDLQQGALSFLRDLGLVAAAVTSPLKAEIFEMCRGSKKSSMHNSVNTLAFKNKSMDFENTDFVGLKFVIDHEFQHTLVGRGEGVVIWGQGAMAQQLESLWPRASVYSTGQNSGESRLVRGPRPVNPSLLVWAASPIAPLPHSNFGASMVWDLNYVEHSAAREWAQQSGATYVSGESLFCRQAAAQRSFWAQSQI